VRLNVISSSTHLVADYIIEAVRLVSRDGAAFLIAYRFDAHSPRPTNWPRHGRSAATRGPHSGA